MKRYLAWLKQSESDLRWGRDSLKSKHFAQVCFIAQQVAEKSLKALAFFKGFDVVKSHSLVRICKELKINGDLEAWARKLDLYYISTRYPDALPDNEAPSDVFGKDQAEEALNLAEDFLKKVKSEMKI